MAYKPIESYGVIGDLHTIALVGMDGSIDWCCLPHFDSPSIFAAILDEHKGGFFKIASLYEAQHKQMYLPDSNVLVTRFLSREGVGEVLTSGNESVRKGLIYAHLVWGSIDPAFQKAAFSFRYCKSNIEMTPLCKVEVTLPRVLGSREVHRGGGGVDEQAGVQPS